MRAERRGRVIVACWSVNRDVVVAGGAGERAEPWWQAVCDFQAAGLGGVAEGEGQSGAEGVDEQSIQAFEANLRWNLYKLWNRLSSGSYLPPPVRAVEIPKKGGRGVRMLGVPTVADRVA
jgi:hypothetical protein